MKRVLLLVTLMVLVGGAVAGVAVSASRSPSPRFCGAVRVAASNARLPVVVLRGGVTCHEARRVIDRDLNHADQRPDGWLCMDDLGPRLEIGKVEHCRFPGGGRATGFVQAYDPNEFNPDQP
jgi:hypothetical protein